MGASSTRGLSQRRYSPRRLGFPKEPKSDLERSINLASDRDQLACLNFTVSSLCACPRILTGLYYFFVTTYTSGEPHSDASAVTSANGYSVLELRKYFIFTSWPRFKPDVFVFYKAWPTKDAFPHQGNKRGFSGDDLTSVDMHQNILV